MPSSLETKMFMDFIVAKKWQADKFNALVYRLESSAPANV
jgi:hypothetical protein